MNKASNLIGGYWNGKLIQVPDHEPNEILMPLVDTELKLLTYERQTDGQYLFKGTQSEN